MKDSGSETLFDDINVMKHTFPEESEFNTYWVDPAGQEKGVEMGKNSAVYERAHYT